MDELREALTLTPVQRAKLVSSARRLADGTGYEPDDLLQEAVARALDGTRSCPRTVAPATFLYNVMRSIASAAWEARNLRPRVASIDAAGVDKVVATLKSPGRSMEESMVAEEDLSSRLEALMKVFKDDADALCVVMGDLDGLEAEDIRGVCSLDKTTYPTVRRRIRRTIERAFPQGWQP